MQDIRDALRALRAAPAVSAVAVLSLALGIGANTAVFSLLNSLLLKSLPVHEPDRLVIVASASRQESAVSYHVWKGIREHWVFERPFAWATDRVHLSSTGRTAFVEAIWATGDFFDVLGVPVVLGRTLTPQDDVRGGGSTGPVAVISYRFWQREFNGTADVIGRPLTIERVPFTIVGITPSHFLGLDVGTAFDVLLPLESEPLLGRVPARLDSPNWPWLRIMARLTPGQTPEAVSAAVRRAQPLIREATMPNYRHTEDREAYLRDTWTVSDGRTGESRFRRQYEPALKTLLAVAGVVLLIACANIATLMLAKATSRHHEFAVRRALGASRARLARQLLVESVLLSAAGATIGLAVAFWGSRLFVRQLSTWAYTAVLDLSIDWRVLGITAATTVATAVLFGIAPAFHAARVQAGEALKHSRGRASGSARGLSGSLATVQVALSLMLIVGAGLFIRSFVALAYRDLGFDRERLLVAIVDAKRSVTPAEGRAALYERIREAAAAIPGVESAAISMATPLGSAGIRITPTIVVPGSTTAAEQGSRILTNPVSPGWFRTFGTRLLGGRDVQPADRAGAPQVAIVNDAFAREYFGVESPVGRTIVEVTETNDRIAWEIVGVVEDAAFTSVRERVSPTIYRPMAQAVDDRLLARFPTISISVRAAHQSPALLSGALAAAISGVDRDLSVSFQTVAEQLNVFYVRERLLAVLSVFFGVFALLLAALGLYGVMSYTVNRRRVEIAIRMALGANRAAVVRAVLGRVALLTVLGIGGGLLASVWAAKVVAALLYGIQPRDLPTFAAAAAVLVLVAGLAASLPLRRVVRIAPATVLREG